mmetsp:Transcript_88290/g.234767  ORF Transcript_88290/g.234767 Transcript_88290/m.234767 type:complete len:106 (+) Transcript_88290:499-816(+)
MLDLSTFIITVAGLAYTLFVYPSTLQEELNRTFDAQTLDSVLALEESLVCTLSKASDEVVAGMRKDFSSCFDSVASEEEKWSRAQSRVGALQAELRGLREQVAAL